VSAATERAPRVLVSGVVLGQPPGGVRRHNAELLPRAARLLAARGGRLALMEGSTPVAFDLPPQVERLRSSVPARPPLARATLEGRWLRRLIASAREPFDLVHLGHVPVPRRLPLPYALTIHDLRALELQHSPMSRRLFGSQIIGRAAARAAAVVTVSETVRASLIGRFRLDPGRVFIVPNAADHLEPAPRAPGPDAPLLHVGHLEPRKNVELLVRALAHDPGLPPLLLAGAAKGDEGRRLAELARGLGVAARVRFHGPFEDGELPRLYAAAACVVLPSRLEGFGLAAIEAQRAGVPLAVSRAGALCEVAGAETPAFDPDDVSGCARAVRAALVLSPAALERAREHAARFTWDRSAAELVRAWTFAR